MSESNGKPPPPRRPLHPDREARIMRCLAVVLPRLSDRSRGQLRAWLCQPALIRREDVTPKPKGNP